MKELLRKVPQSSAKEREGTQRISNEARSKPACGRQEFRMLIIERLHAVLRYACGYSGTVLRYACDYSGTYDYKFPEITPVDHPGFGMIGIRKSF